ncbi:glycoside hydrolase family 3 N-terminal domain-containing protein [Nonomuraea basaltis]|uniref:glycoside hydrolase family 3 N-terminal domain-containing protein n=1 Tax=Nonomuraea basaltis TaxID=2495887 RepID=UPI00110C67AD|nr:glycoside hydrolase family 3 N-terminal domain-containing protein [Nonomuraea basaltis]TMR98069.1 glycoside hydrolase family 3 protein [Nonomuraea basaltis]
MSGDLYRLAMTVLHPGYEGTSAPGWLRRALGEGLGGVVLFARNAIDAQLVRHFRAENPAAVVSIDEEGGTVTRLEVLSGSSFPGNRALGVVDDVDLTERVGRQIGRTLAELDITLNYAPSADVNANPANPVIGVRSFGPAPDLVSRHTVAFVNGVQGAGVAACAKHFPGHGDTVTDSHLALPTVHASRERVFERDLPPFRAAIGAGVRAIMTGHLLVPALDPAAPATLSRTVLTELLRGELGFDGMLVTDAIEMRAVAAMFAPGEIAVRALTAGADAVCVGLATEESLHEIRDAIVAAVRAGVLPEERLAEAAGRVLALSEWYAAQSALREKARGEADAGVGLEAARAALTTTGAAALDRGPLVVEVNTRHSQAVDPGTPTGITAALATLLPGTAMVRMEPGGELPPFDERPVVLVVHDAARHAWVRDVVAKSVAARPDVIVVDTGIPGPPAGAAHVATHGISRVSAQAAAEWLAR